MKKSLLIGFVLVIGIFALVLACNTADPGKEASATKPANAPTNAELIAQGDHLVTVGGCDDCHSPKKMGPRGPEVDMDLRLSGYPSKRPLLPVDTNTLKKGWMLFGPDLTNFIGPWGMSFAANLTSDASGIGNWTEAQFIKALREGKLKGMDNTRPLLPPMPWQNFASFTDNEMKAIFAFLKSTKPVYNVVPPAKAPNQLN